MATAQKPSTPPAPKPEPQQTAGDTPKTPPVFKDFASI